jgi:hypothetical protein
VTDPNLQSANLDRASAALRGGWVTRERLQTAAARSGRVAAPLVKELLGKQAPPSFADLARACADVCTPLRLEPEFVTLAPKAARLLEMELLRRERCVPVEILDDVCVLAVVEGNAERAVRAVREALHRDVLPVYTGPSAIDRALDVLATPRRAQRRGPLRRRDSAIHSRFREIVIEGEVLDAIERRPRGYASELGRSERER